MTVEFHEQAGGSVLSVRASGKLTEADYERFVSETERLIRKCAKIRIVFEMHDFLGWEAGALWKDVKFDLKHFRDVERVAVIGETGSQRDMAMFCKPFTTANIRGFDHNQAAEARLWIEEDLSNRCNPPGWDSNFGSLNDQASPS